MRKKVGGGPSVHKLSEIDELNKTAVCSTCGPTRVRIRVQKNKYSTTISWRCYTRDRKQQLSAKYGVTFDYLTQMIKNQNGLCAICLGDISFTYHVDHDHQTNQIRGLLCHGCNTGLGLFRENTESLHRAIKYLELNK